MAQDRTLPWRYSASWRCGIQAGLLPPPSVRHADCSGSGPPVAERRSWSAADARLCATAGPCPPSDPAPSSGPCRGVEFAPPPHHRRLRPATRGCGPIGLARCKGRDHHGPREVGIGPPLEAQRHPASGGWTSHRGPWSCNWLGGRTSPNRLGQPTNISTFFEDTLEMELTA